MDNVILLFDIKYLLISMLNVGWINIMNSRATNYLGVYLHLISSSL